jgi:hypothetical protein
MKKPVKIKPITFVQDCGTYSDQILVAIGVPYSQIIAYTKEIKAKKDAQEWFLKDENLKKGYEINKGIYAWDNVSEASFLGMEKFKEDSWEMWECLMHEIHHAVHHILIQKKKMVDEVEAQAYLQEYLFRQIRRKIQRI